MLAYAKLERGEPMLTKSKTAILSWIHEQMAELHKEVTVSIHETLPTQATYADIDQRLMGRLLRNLVVNAGRYAASRIDIKLDVGRELGQAAGATTVRLSVADDGMGISAADREHLFEPFRRLDESRARQTGVMAMDSRLPQR